MTGRKGPPATPVSDQSPVTQPPPQQPSRRPADAHTRCLAGHVLLTALAVGALLPAAASADRIYRYTTSDGTAAFSDAPAERPGGYRTYKGSYGRPTAVLSCVGMSSADIDARAVPYLDDFRRAGQQHGIDPVLLQAMARVESCFDPTAVSSVGAQGLMQLMPATAAELGVTDSFDTRDNIDGGARYLAQMLARFDNRLQHALAAYNAGPTAVKRHGGIPPFRETQAYVRRVQHTRQRYAQAAATIP